MKNELDGWKLDLDIPNPIPSKIPKPLKMIPSTLSSVDQVMELYYAIAYFRSFYNKLYLFRGHSDSDYQLVSTIGRLNRTDYSKEIEVYDELRSICDRYGYNRFRMSTFNEELFYYGIGRHLGLTCRLLDWTAGFWDAASFILHDNQDKDGVLWVMMTHSDYNLENLSPFSVADDGIHILKEDYFIPDVSFSFPLAILRRSRQHGFFTVVKESMISTPLNEIKTDSPIEFYRFVIPKSLKESLRSNLHIVSVNEWLYISKTDPIIEEIDYLNRLIVP